MSKYAPPQHGSKLRDKLRLSHLRTLSWRDLLAVAVPAVLVVAAGFWAASHFVRPAPPKQIRMATAGPGSYYQMYATRYKLFLERYGVELVVVPSAGSVENLARLRRGAEDPEGVDAAFIQGGVKGGEADDDLESLGAIYPEPVWVFVRGKPLQRLDQLRGRRIAIGPEGSGTRRLALDLLEAHGLAGDSAKLLPLGGQAAIDAIRNGEVDAVVLVSAARSASVWTLLYMPGVHPMDFSQADAYTRRFPFLQKLTLPQGAVDLMADIPGRNLQLVGPIANVVVHADIHPALADLLLLAMRDTHSRADLFVRAGEFPAATPTDFPLSARARRFYEQGPPLLQRYLPFWIANLIDRLMVLLLPLLALALPLARLLPGLYAWRVRARLYQWYGELKFIERELEVNPTAHTRAEWEASLQRVDIAVGRIPVPLSFADYAYNLRLHVGVVRQEVQRRFGDNGGGKGEAVSPVTGTVH
ncbi:MAG: ABC transporter substrate-binding protein [Rhodocyclaceae bacterium]|nr:ABC transporter substrate-binding protein [Rhodocyclaceae bacterium]